MGVQDRRGDGLMAGSEGAIIGGSRCC